METNTNKGNEVLDTIEPQKDDFKGEKNERKTAPAYALKTFNKAIRNMDEAGLINEKDLKTVKEIAKRSMETYIGLNIFE